MNFDLHHFLVQFKVSDLKNKWTEYSLGGGNGCRFILNQTYYCVLTFICAVFFFHVQL